MTLDAFEALPELEQALWRERYERGRDKCPQCRGPRDRCSDPDHAWYPQRTICYAEMETRAAQRMYERLHKDAPFHNGDFSSWAKEASATHPFHFSDGVTIGVAPVDLNPGDEFTTKRHASPSVGGAEQAHGDDDESADPEQDSGAER